MGKGFFRRMSPQYRESGAGVVRISGGLARGEKTDNGREGKREVQKGIYEKKKGEGGGLYQVHFNISQPGIIGPSKWGIVSVVVSDGIKLMEMINLQRGKENVGVVVGGERRVSHHTLEVKFVSTGK